MSRLTSIPTGSPAPAAPTQHEGQPTGGLPAKRIPYPVALARLHARLGATSQGIADELAAWVFMGPDETNGRPPCGHKKCDLTTWCQKFRGLRAYVDKKRSERFCYASLLSPATFDYLAPLAKDSWFDEDEIERFEPADRYLTGAKLIERWRGRLGGQSLAYIVGRIEGDDFQDEEGTALNDLHPLFGATRGSTDDDRDPPVERGLFCLSEVEAIEKIWGLEKQLRDEKEANDASPDDIRIDPEGHREAANSPDPTLVELPRTDKEYQLSVAQMGGRATAKLYAPNLEAARAAWNSARHTSRRACAEAICQNLPRPVAVDTVIRYLRNTPQPPGRQAGAQSRPVEQSTAEQCPGGA